MKPIKKLLAFSILLFMCSFVFSQETIDPKKNRLRSDSIRIMKQIDSLKVKLNHITKELHIINVEEKIEVIHNPDDNTTEQIPEVVEGKEGVIHKPNGNIGEETPEVFEGKEGVNHKPDGNIAEEAPEVIEKKKPSYVYFEVKVLRKDFKSSIRFVSNPFQCEDVSYSNREKWKNEFKNHIYNTENLWSAYRNVKDSRPKVYYFSEGAKFYHNYNLAKKNKSKSSSTRLMFFELEDCEILN